MRLACRKCGREYDLPADLTARGIYQITCKACGQLVGAEAASEPLRQAAGMKQVAPKAAGPRAASQPLGAATRHAPAPASPPKPRDDGYVDLFDEGPAEPAARPAPTSSPSRPPAAPASRQAPSPPSLPAAPAPVEAPRAPGFERAIGEGARGSRAALVFGGGVALLLVLVAGGLFVGRRSGDAAVASAVPARSGFQVISTAAPPLAAPDPEVAAAEAREEAERYARLRESLGREGPPEPVERRAPSGPAPREAAPVLVGAVKPAPVATPAQVPLIPAQREPLAQAVRPGAEAAARPVATSADAAAVEEAPAFPAAGFEKPSQVVPGCVRGAVRLPRDLAATLSGTLTVRFAVGRDGSVGLIQVMDQVPDSRISDAIAAAVKSCEFRPGSDASGRPARMWVVMPLRFVGG